MILFQKDSQSIYESRIGRNGERRNSKVSNRHPKEAIRQHRTERRKYSIQRFWKAFATRCKEIGRSVSSKSFLTLPPAKVCPLHRQRWGSIFHSHSSTSYQFFFIFQHQVGSLRQEPGPNYSTILPTSL